MYIFIEGVEVDGQVVQLRPGQALSHGRYGVVEHPAAASLGTDVDHEYVAFLTRDRRVETKINVRVLLLAQCLIYRRVHLLLLSLALRVLLPNITETITEKTPQLPPLALQHIIAVHQRSALPTPWHLVQLPTHDTHLVLGRQHRAETKTQGQGY